MKAISTPLSQSISEKDFGAAVMDFARLYGWWGYHTYDSRRSAFGWPDLVLMNPGRKVILFRELKSEKGKITDHQHIWLEMLRECGQDAKVWRPSDWKSIVETLSFGQAEVTL